MNKAEQFIQERLKARADSGSLRKLSKLHLPVDFCSNDYLGFSRSAVLKDRIENILLQIPNLSIGSGGSRLLSGNHVFTEETESLIAGFHQAASGLIFNSGYDANVGLISSLAQRGDTIISDELIHASLIDGARLSHASRYTFKHNDIAALEAKLKLATGNIYVLVESVYSMDGDLAPLTAINACCNRYGANLIVDEAHALGIFGKHGKGRIQELGLEVFARVVTFGKALGCHGAIVLGSPALREYLINFARSFIYTTAAPLHTIVCIHAAYQLLTETDHTPIITERIKQYTLTMELAGITHKSSESSIQTILYNSAAEAKFAAESLQQKGLDVRPILSPTVPKGSERLRICLHTYNTNEEIQILTSQLALLKQHE
ncbi:8-amino-7-oxononanoate synthase [Pedobacter steynii]|uniref:8-amino-7-oxononanoate synthase n=1 Tax=Pedobacter steynii TaxID=430522 RepID=A0A1G9K153_9SPHI|nr:pyridoxal phosphate-dependent aminotransferase family protein [Pedobacter steynii]NQX38406.1 pyridoxal phosphate-dependent aminotransferase family protein [Pedobacter steynii]SDL43094.1 8-amino-7-oxononanoate synthase [Pedobacter steynii]